MGTEVPIERRCGSCGKTIADQPSEAIECCQACWVELAPTVRLKLRESQRLRLAVERGVWILEQANKAQGFERFGSAN